ncbi:MAG: hypothetical protein AB7I27_04200 [Bacteriovoracaceae bacterium]
MKVSLVLILLSISLNLSAQSYLIMENGIIVTTDKDGFAYDPGQFTYPDQVTLKGGQYYVENANVIVTIDETGVLFRKYEVIPDAILGKGINYFLSTKGDLYTINKQGNVDIVNNLIFTRAKNFGGSYFTVVDEVESSMEIYTISEDGKAQKIETELRPRDIVAYGGNYFMTTRGVVYTVSSDGLLASHPEMRIGIIIKKGGNYFTDSSGILYTVTQEGVLKMSGLPMTLRVSAISKLGSNYFIDLGGRFYTVDRFGNVFERVLRDQDLRNVKIISL